MKSLLRFLGAIVLAFCLTVSARALEPASVATIAPEDLVEFEEQPPEIQDLITKALGLTKKKLTYQFGSNSPDNKGMDCSGTVQCTLKAIGLEEVPRSSYDMYRWAEEHGELVFTKKATETSDPVFEKLKPGDLLFWTGTYNTVDRNPPISHVMIFMGTLKADGQGVVFGASDGRRFRGKTINGVSVFDWDVPSEEASSKFIAYGPIPGVSRVEDSETQPTINTKKSVLEFIFKKREFFRQ